MTLHEFRERTKELDGSFDLHIFSQFYSEVQSIIVLPDERVFLTSKEDAKKILLSNKNMVAVK